MGIDMQLDLATLLASFSPAKPGLSNLPVLGEISLGEPAREEMAEFTMLLENGTPQSSPEILPDLKLTADLQRQNPLEQIPEIPALNVPVEAGNEPEITLSPPMQHVVPLAPDLEETIAPADHDQQHIEHIFVQSPLRIPVENRIIDRAKPAGAAQNPRPEFSAQISPGSSHVAPLDRGLRVYPGEVTKTHNYSKITSAHLSVEGQKDQAIKALANSPPEPAEFARIPIEARSTTATPPQLNAPFPATPVIIAQPQSPEQDLLTQVEELEMPLSLRVERQLLDGPQQLRGSVRATPPAVAQVSAQIQLQISKESHQRIEIRLDPPELGRVLIQISSSDQSVSAQIVADRPETLDLMRRNSEILAASLEKAGFAQADLSFQQGGADQNRESEGGFQELSIIADHADGEHVPPLTPVLNGRLDIRL